LCVRGYEPPVLDLVDFVADLRRAMGAERGIAVALAGGRPSDVSTWRRKLATLGDPRVVVARLALEGPTGTATEGAGDG
jgi:hypothetical protein